MNDSEQALFIYFKQGLPSNFDKRPLAPELLLRTTVNPQFFVQLTSLLLVTATSRTRSLASALIVRVEAEAQSDVLLVV